MCPLYGVSKRAFQFIAAYKQGWLQYFQFLAVISFVIVSAIVMCLVVKFAECKLSKFKTTGVTGDHLVDDLQEEIT